MKTSLGSRLEQKVKLGIVNWREAEPLASSKNKDKAELARAKNEDKHGMETEAKSLAKLPKIDNVEIY